ncbi:sensor histidine kinase [Streptomyces acidicola]|uniref:sensor histidine kinase n=1 Tax=Streptomyces acidicola TaxID=2596892 RepID=UPI00382B8300
MSFPWTRWYPRFATQALLAQGAVLALVVGVGFALTAVLLRAELEQQYQQRALTIARAVAADRTVAGYVAVGKPSPDVRRRTEAVRVRTGALFVSVADNRGVRHAHVDPTHAGRAGTVTREVLRGREVVAIEHGTLGTSARGRVPLRDDEGAVVGEVVVGISATAIDDRLSHLLRAAMGFMAGTLLLGVAGVAVLTRRLKVQTLGLEPRDLADLVRGREAVLHGIDEGVLAIDQDNRISVCNDAAARLLGTSPAPGTELGRAGLPVGLRELSEGRRPARGVLVTTTDRTLVVSATPVSTRERDLGLVVTMRDRTELDQVARELDVVRALSDALRAQAHEYTNRLHTIFGLLRLGHHGEAEAYLAELIDDPLAVEHGDGGRLRDPYIRGVLAAKNATASERGVHLRLSDESFVPSQLTAPLDVVTILGNLLDNAIAAAAEGERRPAWVEVSLVAQADSLDMIVADSGDGVLEDLRGTLFEPGITTSADDEQPHGIGLALARQLTRRHGGDLELAGTGGTECGAVFVATLPGVLGSAGESATLAEPAEDESVPALAKESS